MREIRILAPGSLRIVWPTLIAAFQCRNRMKVTTQFGPAGLLRQHIEQGARCDFFASANIAHPQTLQKAGKASFIHVFTHNQLCLTVPAALASQTWRALLSDTSLRVGTSTPLSDPSGDYTWQLFDRIEQEDPSAGAALKQRALLLVGGMNSQTIPQGELAATWLLKTGQADIFIGYQSYAASLRDNAEFVTVAIPAPYQIRADYAFALCEPEARPLADFLLSEEAQNILQEGGFIC